MSTWEERMADRASARSVTVAVEENPALGESLELRRAFLATHPDLTDEMVAAIEAAPAEVTVRKAGEHWFFGAGEMKPYDPARYHWSAEEAWAAYPREGRCCVEPRLDRHWGVRMWGTCKRPPCDHAHHQGEILYA